MKVTKFPANNGPWRKCFMGTGKLLADSTHKKFANEYLVDIELEP